MTALPSQVETIHGLWWDESHQHTYLYVSRGPMPLPRRRPWRQVGLVFVRIRPRHDPVPA